MLTDHVFNVLYMAAVMSPKDATPALDNVQRERRPAGIRVMFRSIFNSILLFKKCKLINILTNVNAQAKKANFYR